MRWMGAAAFLSVASVAHSDIVQVTLSGTTSLANIASSNVIAPGSSFAWSFSYDTTTPIVGQTDSNSIVSSTMTVGSYSWGLDSNSSSTAAFAPYLQPWGQTGDYGEFKLNAPSGPSVPVTTSSGAHVSATPSSFSWDLTTIFYSGISQTSLPTAAQLYAMTMTEMGTVDKSNWNSVDLQLSVGNSLLDASGVVSAVTINGADVAPVPIPAAVCLMVSGLGGISAYSRKPKAK